MGTLSPISMFNANGRNYMFHADFFYVDRRGQSKSDVLNFDDLISFQYQNELNKVCLYAELTYYDRDGRVSPLLESNCSSMNITFCEIFSKGDGKIALTKVENAQKFVHVFIVNNIEILSREQNGITYKLILEDSRWMNFSQNIIFSNNNKSPQDIFDIVKDILVQCCKLTVASNYHDVRSNVMLQYCSMPNDTFFSAYDYLYRRLYYIQQATSIQGLCYDPIQDEYTTFDMKSPSISALLHQETLNIGPEKTELVANIGDASTLGSVAVFPKTLEYENLFAKTFIRYDFAKNDFDNTLVLETQQLQNFVNASPIVRSERNDRYAFTDEAKNHFKYGTEWDNDFNITTDVLRQMFEDNALILNTNGRIGRIVGHYINVSTNMSVKYTISETSNEMKEENEKYRALEGPWLIGKTIDVIDFKEKKYRQNLVLLRNFTYKPD